MTDTYSCVLQADTLTDEEVQIDVCRSLYLEVWVGVTYAYKLIVLAVGAFFAFQTRHVTLPAIKDARMLYVVICSVIVMAIVGLPVILVDNVGMRLKVAVGSLLVWFTVTEVITLLLLPKVSLFKIIGRVYEVQCMYSSVCNMSVRLPPFSKVSFC